MFATDVPTIDDEAERTVQMMLALASDGCVAAETAAVEQQVELLEQGQLKEEEECNGGQGAEAEEVGAHGLQRADRSNNEASDRPGQPLQAEGGGCDPAGGAAGGVVQEPSENVALCQDGDALQERAHSDIVALRSEVHDARKEEAIVPLEGDIRRSEWKCGVSPNVGSLGRGYRQHSWLCILGLHCKLQPKYTL